MPILKTKVQNLFYHSFAFGQPELLMISQPKVDPAFRLPALQQTHVHVAQLRYQQYVHGANKRMVFVVR